MNLDERVKNIRDIISRAEITAKNEKLDLGTRMQAERLILEAVELLARVQSPQFV